MLGRLNQLGVAVLVATAGIVIGMGFATVESLYPGTGVVKSTPAEKPAVARVQECRRVGPVSDNGFGYWWECRVVVRVAGGRVVKAVVDGSVVGPLDAGREVEFREACFGDGDTDCSHGRPVNRAWGFAVAALGIVDTAVSVFCWLMAAVYALRALLGVPRYFTLVNRWTQRTES
ncbi:MAG: DUF6346 domain-containing protein [Micromonosporaceae bacterium]